MHSVHKDHKKELEIISDSQEGTKNHSNTTEIELPKMTFNIQDLSLIKYPKISIDQSAELRLITGSRAHQSDELLQFFHDDSHETNHENNEL